MYMCKKRFKFKFFSSIDFVICVSFYNVLKRSQHRYMSIFFFVIHLFILFFLLKVGVI